LNKREYFSTKATISIFSFLSISSSKLLIFIPFFFHSVINLALKNINISEENRVIETCKFIIVEIAVPFGKGNREDEQ
jgi:hypothetical protein